MPTAVSNSSPLIHLAVIDRFGLLRDFFDEVWVPPAVWREVVEEGHGRPGAADVERAAKQGWLRVVPLQNLALARSLQRDLHTGEAEAIALAVDRRPDVLLLDESDARKMADAHGLVKTGVIGILIRAKLQGKVISLQKELDRLRDEAGLRIADRLYQAALKSVNEA